MITEGPEKWEQLKDLFNKVVDLEPDARYHFLANLRADQRTVYDRLSDLLKADESASSFMDEPIRFDPTLSMIGEKIGSYRIVREIGRGGMGAVFEAVREDGDFARRAAIKLTSHNLFSEDLIRRFQSEKQILARLEHPNIVRLFDGGITANHIPYFVMEYVEGTPITTYCREKEVPIAERLRLFGRVLDAVSYAHRQLVVHRDLKPSNILVTTEGEVKLLDFGIAKSLDGGSATQTIGAPMTPDYAAPEQLAQKPVTTASDIYSLGVELFELLTDLPPSAIYGEPGIDHYRAFLGSDALAPSAAITKPRAGTTAPTPNTHPGETARRKRLLRGDLDNIVLKCLSKEPELRYASADQLLGDVDAFLEGRPVLAHPESRRYRIGKFIRRNRLLVGASLTAILLILSGSGAAIYQSAVARRHQQIAEDRFVQVRKVATSLIFEYHDEIAKLEGSLPLRERLVVDAVNYLDAISDDDIQDPEFLLELGVAYKKIGDVQGQVYSSNLGKLESAVDSYRRSVAAFAKVISLRPRNVEAVKSYADASEGLYTALEKSSSPNEAREGLLEAIATLERLGDNLDHGGMITLNRLRINEAVVFDSRESNLFRLRRLTDLIPYLDQMERRFPGDPANSAVRVRLESYRGNAARFAAYDAEDAEDLGESRRLYELSLVHYDAMYSLISASRQTGDATFASANSDFVYFSAVASSLAGLGDLERARNALVKAHAALDQLSSDKNDRNSQLRRLALARAERVMFIKRGDLAEAVRSVEAAKKTIAGLVAEDPTNIEKTVYGMHFCQEAVKLYLPGRDDKLIQENQAELDRYVGVIHSKYGTELKLKAYF
ncbi:MAG: serine/threonine-protein kinase [Pyrinomonadaceae bacterium]